MTDVINFNATTARFGLPNLFPGQSQKEFFINEGLAILDGILHLHVEGMLTAPPATFSTSECWIVGANATGEWAGQENMIALGGEGGWTFINPSSGMHAFDKSIQQFQVFDGSWNYSATPSEPQGGGVIDAEARAAIGELIAALRGFGVFSAS